jgi:hypothetical protein
MQVPSLLASSIVHNRFETVVQRTICRCLIIQAGSILAWQQQFPWYTRKLPSVLAPVNGGAKESGLVLFRPGRTDWWCGTTRQGGISWDTWGVKNSRWSIPTGWRNGGSLGCKCKAKPGVFWRIGGMGRMGQIDPVGSEARTVLSNKRLTYAIQSNPIKPLAGAWNSSEKA